MHRPTEEVKLDIDSRISDIAVEAMAAEPLDWDGLIAFLRLAYVAGHTDALQEKEPSRLYRAHGYRVPARR